jgi:hypothetical protein
MTCVVSEEDLLLACIKFRFLSSPLSGSHLFVVRGECEWQPSNQRLSARPVGVPRTGPFQVAEGQFATSYLSENLRASRKRSGAARGRTKVMRVVMFHSKRYAECLACSSAGLIFPEAMGLQSAIKVEGY